MGVWRPGTKSQAARRKFDFCDLSTLVATDVVAVEDLGLRGLEFRVGDPVCLI